jgi:hypothetical protein
VVNEYGMVVTLYPGNVDVGVAVSDTVPPAHMVPGVRDADTVGTKVFTTIACVLRQPVGRVYDTTALPEVEEVEATPVEEFMIMAEPLLVHVPPGTSLNIDVVPPTHTPVPPVMTGIGLTDTMRVGVIAVIELITQVVVRR